MTLTPSKINNCSRDVFDRYLSRVTKPVNGPSVTIEKVQHQPGSVPVLIVSLEMATFTSECPL